LTYHSVDHYIDPLLLVDVLAAHPKLTHIRLDLGGTRFVNFRDRKLVDRIFAEHTALEVLRLPDSSTLVYYDFILDAAVKYTKQSIRRIELPGPWPSSVSTDKHVPAKDLIPQLSQLPNLQTYASGKIHPMEVEGKLDWSVFARWPRLEHLSLALHPTADWTVLRPLTKLRALQLLACDVTDDIMSELTKYHPQIRYFAAHGKGRPTSATFCAIGEHWRQLVVLEIWSAFPETVDVIELVRACKHLQYLRLTNDGAEPVFKLPITKRAWRKRMRAVVSPGRIYIQVIELGGFDEWGKHPRWRNGLEPKFRDFHSRDAGAQYQVISSAMVRRRQNMK
jgi:hypothetical protein